MTFLGDDSSLTNIETNEDETNFIIVKTCKVLLILCRTPAAKMDKAYYDDLPHIIKPGKISFNAETYIGNWYEETVRNTLKRDDFIQKRECGDLTIQRTQTMVDLLLKPIKLTEKPSGFLHFGDIVQIVSPGPSCKLAQQVYPFKRNYCKLTHLALSATVPPEAVDLAPYLNTDSIMSASPLLFPVVRNSFIIEHPSGTCESKKPSNQVINYGDVFRIRTFDTQRFPLYLFSAPGIRHHSAATHSGKPKIRLSDLVTADTLWCAHPLDPEDKLRMGLGVPIRLKSKLLLKHNGSGHNLSTEPNFPVYTYFGCELEVSLDSKKDILKNPSFDNIWYFDTDRKITREPEISEADKESLKQFELSAKINANTFGRSGTNDHEEDDDANEAEEEDNDCQVQQYYNPCDISQETQQIPRAQDIIESTRRELGKMSLGVGSSRNGILNYDPTTGPQPHAWSYRMQDNEKYTGFPNRKWNCGDTNCCYTLPPNKTRPNNSVECDKCECVEPPTAGENPNAPIPFKRIIM